VHPTTPRPHVAGLAPPRRRAPDGVPARRGRPRRHPRGV